MITDEKRFRRIFIVHSQALECVDREEIADADERDLHVNIFRCRWPGFGNIREDDSASTERPREING